MAIGLNWMSLHAGPDTIKWHNGGTGGYRTFVGMIPSKGLGVVVLSNTGGTGADDIGMHLLRPELPLARPISARPEFTVVPLGRDVLATYVGTYRVTPQFELAVTLDQGQLFVQATNQGRLPLWPYSDHEFFMKEVEAQVTFERDATGAVTGLVLHQNGRDLPAQRVR